LAHINGRSTNIERLAPVLAKAAGEHWSQELSHFFERTLSFEPTCRFSSIAEASKAWMQAGKDTNPVVRFLKMRQRY
jgi:hypothetical protein